MATQDSQTVTKTYLNKVLKERLALFKEWVSEKFDSQGELIDKKFSQQKDNLLGIKDEIMGELQKMREENATHNFSHKRINDELQEHSRQIKKLRQASPH